MVKSGNHNLRFLPKDEEDIDDKLFPNKLLSIDPPSFRVLYYGGASGSVPFTWESQPGTPKPKHTFSDTSLPPLTPPPSYLSQQNSVHPKPSKSSFLRRFFSTTKSYHASPSFSWSSSSGSSGSYSSPSTPINCPLVRGGGGGGKPHFVRPRSVVEVGVDDDDDDEGGVQVAASLTSTLCFGVRDGASASRKFHGRRRLNKAKNALLSIVDHAKA